MEITISIEDKPGSKVRAITKVVPYPDGGFAVLAPYHSARKGHLVKVPVMNYVGTRCTPLDEMVEYTADDRVKLSIHPDGFVQFSGENPKKIVSGRHPNGKPKGIGLFTKPLSRPIMTGPTFGLTVWGLNDFREAKPKHGTLGLFTEEDFYPNRIRMSELDDFQAPPRPGFFIEAFVLPRFYQTGIGSWNGKRILPLIFDNFQHSTRLFRLRVFSLLGQPVFLGVMVSRALLHFSASSGFILSGPTDSVHALMAVYPHPHTDRVHATSLNYEPGTIPGESSLA